MGTPGNLRCNVCARVVRASTWETDKCACGCRTFYHTKITALEALAFALGIFRRVDLTNLKAVSAPLGGPIEPFAKVWDGINASLREKENGKQPVELSG